MPFSQTDDVGAKPLSAHEMIEYWKIYVSVPLLCNRLSHERNEDFGHLPDDIPGSDHYCYLWFQVIMEQLMDKERYGGVHFAAKHWSTPEAIC